MDKFDYKEAIREAYLIPDRNENGADSYTCPFCLMSTKIKGYAQIAEQWNPTFDTLKNGYAIEHSSNCAMLHAWDMAKE